jgi:SAM-dependent methyltransferase
MCLSCNFEIDATKVDAFTERMLTIVNHGATALMTSIGHRAGLFDRMATLPPATSHEIAEATGLKERYVREWLGAMVTGGIVELDPHTRRFHLPAEHAAALTRQAAPNNVAAFAQYIPLLGSVEDGIVECFREGGGLPYSAFPRFHDVMAEDSGQSVLPALFEHILPLVPGLTARLEAGISVLDVGCGVGKALLLMAAAYPRSRFTGYDFSQEAIARARAEAAALDLDNVRFEVRDAATFDDTNHYELITTFDAVHDQAQPRAVLRNIRRALTADGTYLMQDIGASSEIHENVDHPMGPLLYTVSCMHCMTVSLADDGEGLGAMWGEQQAKAYLAEAGFESVVVHRLAHDVQNYYYVCR